MDFPPRRPVTVRKRRPLNQSDSPEGQPPVVEIDAPRAEHMSEMREPSERRDRGKEPSGRPRIPETLARVLWSIPLIVVAVVVVIAGGVVFALAMIALAVIALTELFRMAEQARPLTYAGFIAAIALIVAAYFGASFQVLLVLVASVPLIFAFALARAERPDVTYSMSVTLLGVIWIGVPLAHAVLLRDLPLHGAALMANVLIATILTDTSAYFGGRLFGRTRLAPSISPGKTVEGLVAGFIGGTTAFWIAGLYQDWLTGIDALILGAAVALVAPVGDLFESLVKRDFGVKDTGRIFGPHGGALDRIDAVLFTVVIGYYLAVALVF